MGHRCHCGRPSPDAFLCTTCTKELDDALADLGKYLPELAVTVTRQDRTPLMAGWPCRWCRKTLGRITNQATQVKSNEVGCVNCDNPGGVTR